MEPTHIHHEVHIAHAQAGVVELEKNIVRSYHPAISSTPLCLGCYCANPPHSGTSTIWIST